jgi:hypothetical protein
LISAYGVIASKWTYVADIKFHRIQLCGGIKIDFEQTKTYHADRVDELMPTVNEQMCKLTGVNAQLLPFNGVILSDGMDMDEGCMIFTTVLTRSQLNIFLHQFISEKEIKLATPIKTLFDRIIDFALPVNMDFKQFQFSISSCQPHDKRSIPELGVSINTGMTAVTEFGAYGDKLKYLDQFIDQVTKRFTMGKVGANLKVGAKKLTASIRMVNKSTRL